MELRPISEREFVNYAKGLGNYCTYGDTIKLLDAVFRAIRQVMGGNSDTLGQLLPPSMKHLWDEAVPAGINGSSIVDLVQSYGAMAARRDAEKALVTLFGTIKEKQAGLKQEWEQAVPDEIKIYWEKSKTIDEVQDAGQCL